MSHPVWIPGVEQRPPPAPVELTFRTVDERTDDYAYGVGSQ